MALTVLLVAPAFGAPQRRRTRRSTAKPAATAAAEKDRRAAATRVADQIKTMTRFLYLLGGAVKTIEDADKALKGMQKPSAADADATAKNKAGVRDSIRNVRVGLEKLEDDFGTKQTLRPYYQHMVGVSATAEAAEQQAGANQFDQAGRSLLKVVGQLTDTLAAMQQPAP